MRAASPLSPHFKIRSGRRPAGDRSRAERPPVTLVALASTYFLYEMADPLQTIVASWVLSLSAIAEGTGAYGS